MQTLVDLLWGEHAKKRYLSIAAVILIFTFLGGRALWTQEHRWADIVAGMFYRHDFFHPYLGTTYYYDKPLLSYWLIAITKQMFGVLNIWTMRLPSACAGLLAVASIYQCGFKLRDKNFGLLVAWLMLTTYYFLFWTRISSADMLNLAGTLAAVAWYLTYCKEITYRAYGGFLLIVALTALCKGLIGAVIPFIVVFIHLLLTKSLRTHLNKTLLLSVPLPLLIYLTPFIISSVTSGGAHENGLYLVYKENFLRYFKPFDHKDPIYTYFIYLPLYTLPWSIFYIPAIVNVYKNYAKFDLISKWILWTLVALFLFLTLSGSRRSYYVLPLLPFGLLFITDWAMQKQHQKLLASYLIFALLLVVFSIHILPTWYYTHYGITEFTDRLKNTASEKAPWQNWHVVGLDADTKIIFYLNLPPHHPPLELSTETAMHHSLDAQWPIIKNPDAHTIFISRLLHLEHLRKYFPTHKVILAHHQQSAQALDINEPIAFVPNA